MTEFLNIDGGTLAYEVTGSGPLVVLAHGMGDSREAFRFLAPGLVAAGYRVATVDLRGCGESSAGWSSYTHADIAGDLLALVRHLGGPAVLIGHSVAGGAVTVAAAQSPELVTALVEISPFTRIQKIRLGDLRHSKYRQGAIHLIGTALLGSTNQWRKYLDLAFPVLKPADWNERMAAITEMLKQPGRMKALQKMGSGSTKYAHEQLAKVACPVLIIEGSEDTDWVSPKAEGEGIVELLPQGLGRVEVIEGAGHYAHVQFPKETLALILPYLATLAPAQGDARA